MENAACVLNPCDDESLPKPPAAGERNCTLAIAGEGSAMNPEDVKGLIGSADEVLPVDPEAEYEHLNAMLQQGAEGTGAAIDG